MRYFKAFEQPDAPFILWQLWAENIQHLAELGCYEDPLIVAEDNIPIRRFGVYVEKIENGVLVSRTEEEITAFSKKITLSTSETTTTD